MVGVGSPSASQVKVTWSSISDVVWFTMYVILGFTVEKPQTTGELVRRGTKQSSQPIVNKFSFFLDSYLHFVVHFICIYWFLLSLHLCKLVSLPSPLLSHCVQCEALGTTVVFKRCYTNKVPSHHYYNHEPFCHGLSSQLRQKLIRWLKMTKVITVSWFTYSSLSTFFLCTFLTRWNTERLWRRSGVFGVTLREQHKAKTLRYLPSMWAAQPLHLDSPFPTKNPTSIHTHTLYINTHVYASMRVCFLTNTSFVANNLLHIHTVTHKLSEDGALIIDFFLQCSLSKRLHN